MASERLPHAPVGEQQALEGSEVVQQALRRRVLDLGMISQRAQRLFLQGADARIELEAAGRDSGREATK